MKNNAHVIAEEMIKQHGSGALLKAMFRIDNLQTDNDQAGVAQWSKIADAIEWLQSSSDLIGDTPH